jgi:hypothetical protein
MEAREIILCRVVGYHMFRHSLLFLLQDPICPFIATIGVGARRDHFSLV